MSDTMHSKRFRDDDPLLVEMQEAMPPVPTPDAIDRVQGRVGGRSARRRQPARQRWVLAGVGVAVLATIAVGVGLSLDGNNAAFARESAIAALAPEGKIVHFVWEVFPTDVRGERRAPEPQSDGVVVVSELAARNEGWVDSAQVMSRNEEYNLTTGDLIGISVVKGTTSYDLYWSEYEDDGVKHAYWDYSDGFTGGESAGMPLWMRELRSALESGAAKIKGTEVVDGVECWKVTWPGVAEDGTPLGSIATAWLAKDNYRPLDCVVIIDSQDKGFRFTVTQWEVLDSADVDPALFDPKLLQIRGEADL